MSEDEVRQLRIMNLHLEDKTRSLHTELIRVKATQNREAELEINRLSQAYSILERETAELRVHLASPQPSSSSNEPPDSSAMSHLSRRLEAEQRLVRQLQERLSLVSDPLDRALRGDLSLIQAAASLALFPVPNIIDQLAKFRESEIFSPTISALSDLLSVSLCHDLLLGLLPLASSKSCLFPLARKCSEVLSPNLRDFLASDADWLTCVSNSSEISELISMFGLRCRPPLPLDVEYALVRAVGSFRALRLVPLLRGGHVQQRLCLLRAAINDATHLLSVHPAEAAVIVDGISKQISVELQCSSNSCSS